MQRQVTAPYVGGSAMVRSDKDCHVLSTWIVSHPQVWLVKGLVHESCVTD